MAKTYAQLSHEIDALRRQAEQARQKEMAVAIAGMKAAIEFYGLTADDLGLADGAHGPGRNGKAGKPAKPPKGARAAKAAKRAKYRDGNGNSWTGMGPRPGWLKAAIAAGQSLESFAATDTADGSGGEGGDPRSAAGSNRRAKHSLAGAKLPAKYKDDAGNAWSGRGSTPRWLKAALDSGKTLAQLAV